MKLPTLYKTSSKGAIQVLNIKIEGAVYTREWGQLGGKQQTKSTTASGKNLTKSNKTSDDEQAIIEAKAVWTKKQKTGYSLSAEAPVTVKLPMKVNEYKKHLKKIASSVYTSPKLNGVNAEYRRTPGANGEADKLKLLSRGGEEYPIPSHQEKQVLILLKALGTNSINGEMYCHGEHLQDIMAATKKHNELTLRLKFYVFDFPEVPGTYQERCSLMYDLNNAIEFDTSNIPFVQVWTAHSPEEIEQQYNECIEKGYEGLIIRNPNGLYKYNTRSLDVFKYKKAQDGEFEVCGFDIDKNGHTVFLCYKNNNHIGNDCTFKVKLKGTNEERLAMAANAQDYIGKWLKIEYEMLSKDLTPLKPVGITFREVDINGEATE